MTIIASRKGKRLFMAEEGNVLYVTVVMMMILVVFSLLLINVIHIGITKIRAQNAADNIAISAATLKARLLNQVADVNAGLFVALEMGTINETRPYATPLEAWIAQGLMWMSYIGLLSSYIPEYHRSIYQQRWLDRIAVGNGLDLRSSRFHVFPVDVRMADPYGASNDASDLSVITALLKYLPGKIPLVTPIVAYEPTNTWFVQSRVEISVNTSIIGGNRLGTAIPCIVARSRAELVDRGQNLGGLAKHYSHYWRVRLAQPDEDVDREIRCRTGSLNTGAGRR
ncbi:hypothetical protein JW933_06625 [candidate division FCPU426 bacterium]|nr:hypothetical protein [candidate division FCPU426 bacterium]